MKRLSELPERDKTDETQQLIGDNPIKLLVNSPTGDILVKPENLMANIAGAAGSFDTWANLEQIKEAYEKGPEIVGQHDLFDNIEWFKEKFLHCQSEDTFVAYLPNVVDNDATGQYKSALSNLYKTKNYVTYGTLNYPGGSDIRRFIINETSNNKELYITINNTSINTASQRFIGNNQVIQNIKCILNFPNLTSVDNASYGLIFTGFYAEDAIFNNFDCTILLPKVTKGTGPTDNSPRLGLMFSVTGNNTKKNWHVKAYLPSINDTVRYYGGINASQPIEFSDIKYLLDNINKAPADSIIDKDRVLIKIIKAGTPSSLTISITDSSGTSLDNYNLLSDIATNSAETIAEIINTDSSLNNLVTAEVFKATSGSYVLVTSKNEASITAMTSSNTASFTTKLIAKEASTGGPLNIHCGVSSAYGENYTLPDGTTGWRPIDGVTTTYDTGTVNLASYINQFYIDCNFKWQIGWYPTTHE